VELPRIDLVYPGVQFSWLARQKKSITRADLNKSLDWKKQTILQIHVNYLKLPPRRAMLISDVGASPSVTDKPS
jgi:hypothetical protein